MRTDRQNKIYLELKHLLTSLQSTATPNEKAYLQEAKASIDEGKDFNRSINALNWNLKKVKARQEGLSSMVNDFYEKTISYYGEPRQDPQYIHWTDINPDPNVYFRGGRTGGWRDDQDEKGGISLFITFFVAQIVLFLTPVGTKIKMTIGDTLYFSLAILILLLYLGYLVVSGRIKKK